MTARILQEGDGPHPVRAGSGLVYIGPPAGKTGSWTQNRNKRDSSSRPRASRPFVCWKGVP